MKIEVNVPDFCPERCRYMSLDYIDISFVDGLTVRTYYCTDERRCRRQREFWIEQEREKCTNTPSEK